MKNRFFTLLLRVNLALVALVLLLGTIFLFHHYGNVRFGESAFIISFATVIYSSPLWFGLFVCGFQEKHKSDWETVLFPFPMIFMLTYLFVLGSKLVD